MANQMHFIENNLSTPIVQGVLSGAGGAIASKLFPGLIGINPAVSAVFMATFTLVDELSMNFLNHYLKSTPNITISHPFTFTLIAIGTHALSLALALKITAISATILQLIPLMFFSAILGNILGRLIVPSTPNAPIPVGLRN